MFKKPLYKRLTELGTGGTRADDVNDRPATNVAKPTDLALKRQCVEGLVYAAKLQALLDKHADSIPEQVRDLAYTCIEASEAFNTTLERIGEDQPIIIRTESKHPYSMESLGPAPPIIRSIIRN